MTNNNHRGQGDSLDLEDIAALLRDGYTDGVRAFTDSIKSNRKAVREFESIYDLLNEEATIHWVGTPSQIQSINRIEASHSKMLDFLAGAGGPEATYLSVTNHGSTATFDIGWMTTCLGEGEPVLWDRWTSEVDDPVIAFADAGFMFDLVDYQFGPPRQQSSPPQLYRYHPQRFKSYRDYVQPVGQMYLDQVTFDSGVLSANQLRQVMNMIVSEVNNRGTDFPRKHRDKYPPPSQVVEAEEGLAQAYGRFVQGGRQIFEFTSELLGRLAEQDVSDLRLAEIKPPYTSQYLHFGPQTAFQLESGWVVDGVYVDERGQTGELRFTFTAIPDASEKSAEWYLVPEQLVTLDFVGDYRHMVLGEALGVLLSERTAWMENALSLAVNALRYASSHPDDTIFGWPPETPNDLRRKASEANKLKSKKAKKTLLSLGYVPVHFCCVSSTDLPPAPMDSANGGV